MRELAALGAGWALAGAALVGSAAVATALGVIFHFHPAVAAAGAAWVARRLNGGRPSTNGSIALLFALVAELAWYQATLEARTLADPEPIAAAIGLPGLALAGWILLRRTVA